MARGRMVNKKISNSKRVNDLPLPAQLLYTWLIPHLDVNGCFYGSAQMVKSLVFPRKKMTTKRIETFLKLMENASDDEGNPLIIRYFADGEQYLLMPGFEGEQIGLRRDKESPEFPTFDGKMTETLRKNVGVRGREGEVEEEVKLKVEDNNPPIVPPSESSSSDSNIFELYEQEVGKLTPMISEQLKEAEKVYGAEMIKDAIEIAVKANIRKWSYIAGVLENRVQEAEDEKLKDYASIVSILYRARKKSLGKEPAVGELSEIRLRVKEALLRGETQEQILSQEEQFIQSKKGEEKQEGVD